MRPKTRPWFVVALALVCCGGDEDARVDAGAGAGGALTSGSGGKSAQSGQGGGGASAGSKASGGTLGGSLVAGGSDAGESAAGEGAGGSGASAGKGGAGAGQGGAAAQGGSNAGGSGGLVPIDREAIVGFGVNGQPRNWGTDGEGVRTALDLLVDDLGASFFRVEIFRGVSDWEADNDDEDPETFDWSRFDEIFESKDFRDLWDYIRYLNGKGVFDIELAAHGWAPEWMGGDTISPSMSEEYVETLLAVLLYAKTRAPEPRPVFTTFAPWNEPDLGTAEGVDLGAEQGGALLHRLVERMNEYPELDAVDIVAPETASVDEAEDWEEALLEDPLITARLRAIGFHRYGGYAEDRDRSDASVPFWLTEFNAAAGFCYEPSWQIALDLAGNLLSALESGVKAGLVWSDYDAPHSHSGDAWETFGLLQTSYDGISYLCDAFPEPPSPSELDRMTYSPKPSYYAAKHAFRHVRPGALRRPLGPGAEGSMVAFDNLDGSTAVYGVNFEGADEFELELGSGAPSSLRLYVSTEESQHEDAGEVTLQNGTGTVSVPAESVFTLVGGPG